MTRGLVAALVLVAVALPQTEAMDLARRAFDLARQGRVDEAIAQLREAVRLEPANPQFQSAMGGIFERQGKLAEAVAAFGEAARLAPTNDAMRQRLEAVSLEWGAELARAQRNRAGLVLAHDTVKRFPRSPRAHLMLGLFETRNQQNLAAVAAYRRALELDPHAAEARFFGSEQAWGWELRSPPRACRARLGRRSKRALSGSLRTPSTARRWACCW